MFVSKHYLDFTHLWVSMRFFAPALRGAFCALLLTCTNWSLASSSVPLLAGDTQLKGAQASLAVPITVSGSSPKPIRLRLEWNVSGLVDPKRSVVNMLVNGQIRSTRKLSDLGGEDWQLNLRPLNAGRHELRVQVYLRGKDEDCIPLPEGLWLTLLPSSRIEGALPYSTSAVESSIAVKDFPQAWRTTTVSTPTSSEESKPAISLLLDHPWDATTAAAYTQAQIYLARQGIRVLNDAKNASQSSAGDSRAGQLVLRVFDGLEPNHPARKRWAMAADTRFVLHASAPNRLEVITKNATDISPAVELLANDALRALCHESLCSSGVAATTGAQKAPSNPTPDLLWSMALGDQPRGWSAQGAGVHKLRQVWVRPLGVDLQSDVNLFLAARASKAAQVDASQSSINIRINDQPLATYSLLDWKTEHALVRIPESLWRAPVWVIDFEVRLTPRPQQRCSYLVQEDFWVALDPSTKLRAKFEYREAAGIAGFWQRASEKPTLTLAWSEPGASAPKREQLAPFIALLQAFGSREVDLAAPRWTFVNQAACKGTACIVLHPQQSSTSVQERLLPWRKAVGKTAKDVDGLPDLSVAGTAVIAWTPQDGSSAEQLHIVLGAPKEPSIPAPQLSGFNGPIAVHTDQWQFFASAEDASKLTERASGQGNVSLQQGRLRWVNLIWALMSVVIIVTLAMLYWRKKKRADPKTWEVS
jgi:hypothetical protein